MENFFYFLKKALQRDSLQLLGIIFFWRIIITLGGIIGMVQFRALKLPSVDISYSWVWDMWSRWDGWYYVDISLRGYFESYTTAFFPLYPLLLRGVSHLLSINPVFAGLLISHLALWGALYFVFKISENLYSKEIALWTILLLLFFPFPLFFGLVYTESLFLFFAAGALFFARKEKWVWVFFFSFFAALTRNLGVLLFFPLCFEYVEHYHFRFQKSLFALSGPILGLITYMLYLFQAFGNPLQFVLAQSHWERKIVLNPWTILSDRMSEIFSYVQEQKFMELSAIVLGVFFLYLAILSFKKKYHFPKSLIAFSFVLLLPGLLQNTWGSVNRYVVMIFPAFLLMAVMLKDKPLARSLVLAGFAFLLGVSTILFVNFRWVG